MCFFFNWGILATMRPLNGIRMSALRPTGLLFTIHMLKTKTIHTQRLKTPKYITWMNINIHKYKQYNVFIIYMTLNDI